jgi:hypothetical protein
MNILEVRQLADNAPIPSPFYATIQDAKPFASGSGGTVTLTHGEDQIKASIFGVEGFQLARGLLGKMCSFSGGILKSSFHEYPRINITNACVINVFSGPGNVPVAPSTQMQAQPQQQFVQQKKKCPVETVLDFIQCLYAECMSRAKAITEDASDIQKISATFFITLTNRKERKNDMDFSGLEDKMDLIRTQRGEVSQTQPREGLDVPFAQIQEQAARKMAEPADLPPPPPPQTVKDVLAEIPF